LDLRCPYSGCFVDSGNGGGDERGMLQKLINPSPILLREGFLFLVQFGRLDEDVFPPLTGSKLKKSAFDELQEYYWGLMN
jgi:hypothetical protein